MNVSIFRRMGPSGMGLMVVLCMLLTPSCRRVIRPHDRAQLHNNQGVVYLNRREYDKAQQEFKIAVELSPEYADAYHNLGVLYEQTGDLKRAEESYLKSIEGDYKYAQPHNGLCSVYVRQGKYEDAVTQAKKALKKDKLLADAAYCMGLAYNRIPERDEAAKAFRKATDLDPNHYLGHNELGKVYLQRGDYDDAINRFKVATEVFPTFEEGWKNLGYTYYLKGDFPRATQSIKAALGLNERNPTNHKLLAALYLKQGNAEPPKAINYCKSAVAELRFVTKKLDKFDGEAFANLGLAERCVGAEERRAGRTQESLAWLKQAEQTLREAIQVDPENCFSYFYLGELLLDELREKDKGIVSLEGALDCSKKSKKPLAVALYKLGSLYMEGGQTKKGVKLLCEFLSAATPTQTEQVKKASAITKSYGGC